MARRSTFDRPSNARKRGALLVAFACATSLDSERAVAQETPSNAPSFRRDVAPILIDRCLGCHGTARDRGNYRLDTFERLLSEGDSEEAPIVAGKPEESHFFELLVEESDRKRMPKDGARLPESELEILRAWIAGGAPYDADDRKASIASIVLRAHHPAAPDTYPAPVPITALAFSPDGKELAASGYHEVTFWSPARGEMLRRIGNVEERTLALEYSASGEFLLVAGGTPGRHGEVTILDPRSGRIRLRFAAQADVVLDASFDANVERVAVATPTGAVLIHAIPSGREIGKISAHADVVTAVAWSPDGSRLATASRDKTAKVFDVASGQALATYAGHGAEVQDVAFDLARPALWSSGVDRRIHGWVVEDAKREFELGGFSGEVSRIALRGNFAAVASADKTTRIYRSGDRGQVQRLEGHGDWLYSVAIDPSAERVASGSFTGEVRIWTISDGKPVATFVAVPPPRRIEEF
jgi:hypothetical protein